MLVMSGRELAERLRHHNRECESLLSTGHAGPPLLVLIAGTEGLFGRMRNES